MAAPSRFLILSLALFAAVMRSHVSAQIMNNPCTPSMMMAFAPCMSFAPNTTLNGTTIPTPTPSADCCSSIKALMTNGKDCLCLVATGSPFQIPINRTIAVSLPRACNMPGVPLQCKAAAAGAPVPAPASSPGPVANGPSPVSPKAAAPPSGIVPAPPEPLSPRSAPGGVGPPPTPPGPATNGGATPGSNPGSRAGATPSAGQPAHSMSPLPHIAMLGVLAILKCY